MDDPFPGYSILTAVFTQPDAYYVILYVIAIVLLFIGSALVSGSEVAYFSLGQDEIDQSPSADLVHQRISGLISKPKKLLATILILNNFINISIVMISSFFSLKIFDGTYSAASVIAALTIIITILIVFVGEIVPKVYANQHSLSFAKRTALLLTISFKFFSPLSWLLINVSGIIERRISKKGYNVSVDELNEALEIATDTETTKEEKEILKGIVNFGTLSVKQIMKSRMDITAIDLETDFHELMNQINKTGFSRIPVFKEKIDQIEGILYIKDLLPHIHKEDDYEWQKLLRPGFFVPESKKIDTLFKDFQERRIHIAIVVDEYGGTSGLITMEDVIEEIVGEINDEFDEDSDIAFNKLDKNTFVFEGKTSLMDFCKIANVEHKIFDEIKGESESLGGLLLEINGKLPNTGEQIIFQNFQFTPVAVNDKRIKKVRVFIKR
ncbi:MAG: gliding motility-associated protein GldE [Reichenbachiella sp.]